MSTRTRATKKKTVDSSDEYVIMKNISGQEVRVRNTKENIDYLKSLGWKK